MGRCFSYHGVMPKLGEKVFLAHGSVLIGDIKLSDCVSIWYNVTLRADVNKISVGYMSSIQDNSVIHEDSGRGSGITGGQPTIVGDYVTVGHGCILHACVVEDCCLIGMGATILDGAVIGKGSVVGAGALVTKNMKIPPFSLVVGVPAKVVKTFDENTIDERISQAKHYFALSQEYLLENK